MNDNDRQNAPEEDFASLLDASFTDGFARYDAGERIDGKIVAISQSAIMVDIGQRTEGIVDRAEFDEDEMAAIKIGDILHLWVVRFTGGGTILSKAVSVRSLNLEAMQSAAQSGIPIEGKVSAENKGGYTVDLPGCNGFVPHSQIEYGPKKAATEYIGKTLKFRVLEVRGRDVVLSRAAIQKAEMEDERARRIDELREGMILMAPVVKIESFGAFVDIGGYLNALVPRSETAWSRQDEAMAALEPGKLVSVKIMRIDREGERPRISASIRQAGEDPWDTSVGDLVVGQVVTGKVTRIKPFGAFVEISDGIEGLLHVSEMALNKRIKSPTDVVTPGQEIQVSVISVDRVSRKVSLSLKAIQAVAEAVDPDLMERFSAPTKRQSDTTAPAPSAPANTAMAEALRKALAKR